MAGGTLGANPMPLRDLFGGGTAVGQGDGELLRRYAGASDEAAFAALVARHGPMVAATCRAVLRDHHDAEDAFQATFLVLARRAGAIRAGEALGGWLHRVAYRAAVQRRIEVERRRRAHAEVPPMEIPDRATAGTDLEACSILHQEIDRLPEALRLPVVLCDLEGLTYEQAAGRLRCTVPTLYHRLAKGRTRLRDRLVRRGLTAAAAGAALEASRASASAAVPAAWASAAIAAAAGGAVPPAVVGLANSLIRSLFMTRLRTMAVGLLALGTMISAGVVALAAARPEPAIPPAPPAPQAASSPPAATVTPKPPAAPEGRGSRFTVEARDLATDALVPDVHVELKAHDSSRSPLEFASSVEAPGVSRFSLSGEAHHLYLTARRPGYVPQAIRWDRDANAPAPPDRFLFQMEKSTTVSGRVVDQDDRPIAGATVVIDVSKHYPRSTQWVDIKREQTRTDAEGRWSFDGVPAAPDSVELTAYHLQYLTEHNAYILEEFRPLSALRDGSATLRLRRGTPVEVTVRSAAGQPVADAEVFYGLGRRYGNAIPPMKTDSQGKLTLGIKPGTASSLTARAPGLGPAMETIRVGTQPLHVEFTLPAPQVLRGRVVDPARKPIAGATVYLSWSGPATQASENRGGEAIALQLTTDADGRFAWNEAPPGGIRVGAYAPGFSGGRGQVLEPGTEHEIVLASLTTVKGSVLDAETGQPISRFTLSQGAVWNPGERLIWQRSDDIDRIAKKAPGAFESIFGQAAHEYTLRASADGYLPDESGLFSPDGTPRAFTFRLRRAEPIRGVVTRADASPAVEGFVYLVPPEEADSIEYLDIQNGSIRDRARSAEETAKIGPDGRFTLPPQKGNFALVALCDAGFAIVHRREIRGEATLRLRPWARVAGAVTLDGKPAAGLEIQSQDPDRPLPVPGEPRLDIRYYTKTDAAGRFEFRRVMPGRLQLARWVPNGIERRIWFINLATIDVESGRSYDLAVGRSGRQVTGRLEIPGGGRGAWMIRKAEIVARGSKETGEKPAVSLGVEVLPDGRIRAQDMPPGEYRLRVALHEPPPGDACGWGRLIAAYEHEFTIAGTAEDSPLDLGVLRPIEVAGRTLAVGDSAPDFAFRTLDGKELKLADFRGRVVLLDFWATWCAPCLAEMPNLAAIHKAYGLDPRFALISVSLDEKPAEAAYMAKDGKWAWQQGHVGFESPTVAAYGATSIPATFLIGPDGKVLATGLRGEALKAAVAAAVPTRRGR